MRHFSLLHVRISQVFFVLLACFAMTSFVFAQDPPGPGGSGQNFVTLVPQLPLLGNQTSVPALLNALFGITVGVAAILAVLMFTIGGFRYMASEAIGSKGDAKSQMQSAVLGLLLVLAAVLILNTINPDITMLNIFRNVPEEVRPPDGDLGGDGTLIEMIVDCPAAATGCCTGKGPAGTTLESETRYSPTQMKCVFRRVEL